MAEKKLIKLFKDVDYIPDTPPIWVMRQAGRYLPEYLEVRSSTGTFLDLCYNPEKAAEVTLQPLKRFSLDAAIIFSDILIVAHSLGVNLSFEKGSGPVLEALESEKDLQKLTSVEERLEKTCQALSIVKSKLPNNVALIGFAGAPWTVATYMIEGKGGTNFEKSKKTLYENPSFLENLIEIITNQTVKYLLNQIEAGADIIKIFDSWAGILCDIDYDKFVIKPTNKIITEIRKRYPDIPIIGFPKGSGYLYERYLEGTKVDGLALDYNVPVAKMAEFAEKGVIVQGNLDPSILLTNKDVISERAGIILDAMKGKKHIFNLGHGILPETKIENMEFLVNYVRSR
ncbi:MAG: uroporphyrinogen decarboxylase [Rickettsiaceae bacterium]|nr:uroporphyrinogen decarboxylase [Rickettsiaceae bacterium]